MYFPMKNLIDPATNGSDNKKRIAIIYHTKNMDKATLLSNKIRKHAETLIAGWDTEEDGLTCDHGQGQMELYKQSLIEKKPDIIIVDYDSIYGSKEIIPDRGWNLDYGDKLEHTIIVRRFDQLDRKEIKSIKKDIKKYSRP